MTTESTQRRDWILAVVARHEASLIRYATAITGEVDEAKDCVQETFLQLCTTPREQVEAKLAAWLFTVCRNKALDARRREKRMTTVPEDTLARNPAREPTPAAAFEQQETRHRLLQWVDRLPARQREVLQLKFAEGLSYREISSITGESESNVGYLLHCGVATIREHAGRESRA